nr:immunoglobulin light chain junction region [Macaca mulatta]MOX78926.1 immunoglobulin light chain junction region [Macaca mulatta]MOX81228.1 immunoglobulin light chain junction region [Macaca mulatta]MOX84077.1 immunoglobulin light chain junction region [Macaca mulatta]
DYYCQVYDSRDYIF